MCGKDSVNSRSFVMGLSVEKGLESGSRRSHGAKRMQKRSGLRPGSWPVCHQQVEGGARETHVTTASVLPQVPSAS